MTLYMTTRYGHKSPSGVQEVQEVPRVQGVQGLWLRYAAMVILMMVVGVCGVKAQIAEGFYYIASNAAKADNGTYSYKSNDPSKNFYLCPAIGCYYDNNIDQPNLTTFKTNQDQNSLWNIKAVSGETDCYYLIHYKTGKYLASNPTPNYNIDGNINRKVVHLEKKAANDDSDIYKFYIKYYSSYNNGTYQIYPKDYRPGGTSTSANSMSLNPKGDNWSMYVPQNGLATGIIGVYAFSTDNKNRGSEWKIEPLTPLSQPCATPLIKYDGDQINISYPYSDETGITIYYTTDGTNPSTSSSSNASTSFNISADGVVKVRAFAAKSGYVNSDEAVLWGSARPFLIQSKEDANYYLVPAGNGTDVNTTSIAGEPMQWTFQNAGASTGGLPYYYLVNSNGKKINYKTSDNTLTLNEESNDANKFCIIEDGNTGEFFIIPISGASTGNDKNCRAVFKSGGNTENTNTKAEIIYANNESNINRVHWLLRVCNEGADQKSLFSGSPFSVSNNETLYYYDIASLGTDGYYIVPPFEPEGYARTSNTKNPWIFKVAASDNWLTYYYIINAATGKYMYFNPGNKQTKDQENVISMKSDSEKNSGNEERFQFIMVPSTTTDAYYIVPKGYSYADESHINFNGNKYFGLWFDDGNPASLKTTWSRSATANNVKWTFEKTTIAPTFSTDGSGNIIITHPDNDFDICYTTDGTEPTSSSEVYSSSAFSSSQQHRIKAIAVSKTESSIVSAVATLLNKPTVTVSPETYTYNSMACKPGITVSISNGTTTTTAPTYPTSPATYTVGYTDNINVGTASVSIADADEDDNWYIWNAPNANFTIEHKAVTITANSVTKGYDHTPLTESGFTTSPLEEGDTHTFTVVMTEESTITNLGTISNVIATVDGTSVTTDIETVVGNYKVTTKNGTLEITERSLGDGNLAPGFTIEFRNGGVFFLKDGEIPLEESTDYIIASETTSVSGRYSEKTISGKGNYIGEFAIRNAIVNFQTDADEVEWSATFVAENAAGIASNNSANGHKLPDGITAYIITAIEGNWAIPKPLEYIPEGIPVLLVSDKKTGGFLVEVASGHEIITTEDQDANMLVENTASTHFDARTIYLLSYNEFVHNMDGDLAAGKVYLNPSHSSYSPSPAPVRLRIMWEDVTGIEGLQNDGSTETRNDSWYTLDGRKLNGKPTRKGMYIVKREKVIIR